MAKVIVDGFKSIGDAEEFIRWYQGSGEQDADTWVSCATGDTCETSMYDLVLTADELEV